MDLEFSWLRQKGRSSKGLLDQGDRRATALWSIEATSKEKKKTLLSRGCCKGERKLKKGPSREGGGKKYNSTMRKSHERAVLQEKGGLASGEKREFDPAGSELFTKGRRSLVRSGRKEGNDRL